MSISASDYIQLGSMIITIATTFVVPFFQRPMLSVDYPNYTQSAFVDRDIAVANNGITALHNIQGSIVIPHAVSSIKLIPDKYIPWNFAVMQKNDSQSARASFNMSILPPQVAVNVNVKANLANGYNVSPLISVFSNEGDGNAQLYIWAINGAAIVIVSIFSYKFYRLIDKIFVRHDPPAE